MCHCEETKAAADVPILPYLDRVQNGQETHLKEMLPEENHLQEVLLETPSRT